MMSAPPTRGLRTCALLILAALLLLGGDCAELLAAAPKKPSLDALYKAISREDYGEAKRQADALLPQAARSDRLKISLAYGRVLLGLKQNDAARQYLAAMARETLDGDGPRLMEVYAAWLTWLDGKPDAAIKTLEDFLAKNISDAATAEAADVLAMLYMERGDTARAKRAVDFGLGALKYQELKTPYIETLLRNRLKSKSAASDDEKQYLAAEKLRQQEKYSDAGQAFFRLRQQYPKSPWSDAAGFRIGQCFLGLNRAPEANAMPSCDELTSRWSGSST